MALGGIRTLRTIRTHGDNNLYLLVDKSGHDNDEENDIRTLGNIRT